MTQRDELSMPEDAALLARLALDDRPGPATRISSARAHALVEGALDAAMKDVAAARWSAPAAAAVAGMAAPAATTDSAPASLVSSSARWLRAQRPLVRALSLAAAALLALAGGAAAMKLVAAIREPEPAPAPVERAPRAARPLPVPAAAPAPAEELVPEDTEDSVLDVTAPGPRAHRGGAARSKDPREGALEDLLQQANRARAAGEFREAAALYAEVYQGRPSSLSAYVALVAAGSLELEHLDRPLRARKLFEAALAARPKGALDLEARQGLVLALRDLGARGDEIAALRKLIALHPTRPAAARARARLAELGE